MASVEMIKYLLGVNRDMVRKIIDDISEEESMVRGGDELNHIRWQTGHLLYCEIYIANLLGNEPEDDSALKKMFGGGSVISDDGQLYPPMSELKERLYAVQKKGAELAEKISENVMESPVEGGEDDAPRWRQLTFLLMHAFYHAGMIVNLRKIIGRERPFG